MIDFKVNPEKCVHCGQCAADCPANIIRMKKGLPVVSHEERCLKCQHCLAVCPTGAISILGKTPEDCLPMPEKTTERSDWLKGLIRGRRSVRRFLPEDLSREEVTSLLETAWHAPTGHNDQTVRFAVVHGQEAMKTLKEEVYYLLGETLGDGTRSDRSGAAFLGWALSMWQKKRIDIIFRDAPNLLVAYASKNATTPKEDCIIALSTFDLAAQAVGIGTLWDGFATWSIGDFCPGLPEKLGIPKDHTLVYAMVFGKPAVTYHRTVDRSPAPIHWALVTK